MLFYILFWIAFIPISILFPSRMYGKKNLVKGKSILVCNHTSNADVLVLYSKIKKKIRFLGKKELASNKFKRWFFCRTVGMIPIDRSGTDVGAIKKVIGALKDEKYVGIFPQGTRSEEDADIEAKQGTCLMAIKGRAPIVPMYIVKKPRVFRRNKLIIGKAFELSEFYDKKLTKEVLSEATQILVSKMNEVKSEYYRFENECKVIKKLKKSH